MAREINMQTQSRRKMMHHRNALLRFACWRQTNLKMQRIRMQRIRKGKRLKLAAWGLLVFVCSCDVQTTAQTQAPSGAHRSIHLPSTWANRPRGPGDSVVARVDGHPLFASDVTKQLSFMTASGSAATPRQALETLIDFEVLAHRAQKSSVEPSPEVFRRLRQALVGRYLEDVFESHTQPGDIPDEVLRRYYAQLKTVYDHERRVHVLLWHLEKTASPKEDAVRFQALKALRVRFLREHGRTGGDALLEHFKAAADSVAARDLGLRLYQEWVVSPVDAFAQAVLQLPDVSSVSRTLERSNAYAVAVVQEVQAPRHVPFESAREEIRALVYERWRQQAFDQLTRDLSEKSGAWVRGLATARGSTDR